MPYCITLRSRTNASITAWYDGSRSRWSTDHTRQKLFDKKRGAKPVCHELRRLCPRNAKVINIEPLLYRSEVLDQIGWRALSAGAARAARGHPGGLAAVLSVPAEQIG